MENKIIKNKLVEIIKNNVSIFNEDIDITESTDIINDLDMDSVMLMQLVIDIEDNFKIVFDDDMNYEDIKSFTLIYKYIIKKMEGKEDE